MGRESEAFFGGQLPRHWGGVDQGGVDESVVELQQPLQSLDQAGAVTVYGSTPKLRPCSTAGCDVEGGWLEYNSARDTLQLWTTDDGTSRRAMSIQRPSGDIGMGLLVPSARLHVKANSSQSKVIKVTGLPTETTGQDNVLLKTTNRNQWLLKAGGMGMFFAADARAKYHSETASSNPNELVFVKAGSDKPVKAAIDLDTGDGYFDELHAREVTVESDWADFVFKDDCSLKPLGEVDTFIRQHGHLPEVPSAKEVQTKGIALGKSQALLLQKIEELTLYAIEQQKQLDSLKRACAGR
ncbi:hypothetical protein ACFL5O_04205 [Myxococcota bacterium]